MKKIIRPGSILIAVIILLSGCVKHDPFPRPSKELPPDVAIAWMKMHMRLTMSTPGFNSVVAGRSIAYAGLTLHESLVPGMSRGSSLAYALSGGTALKLLLPVGDPSSFYGPASANAAMAAITKTLFGNTSVANVKSIDSLEATIAAQFAGHAKPTAIAAATTYGKKVAEAVFNWSKTDGGHEAYLHVTSPSYVPPTGWGLWIPTPPAFSAPIHPGWKLNRTFIPATASLDLAPPPLAYSTDPSSPYYKQAAAQYQRSLSLTKDDTTMVRFWGDLATNYNVPAHATGILTQLIELKKFNLDETALAYAKHGFALNDALIAVLKSKYYYNTMRPVSYIRSVLNQPNWNTVIPTPPHPEYPAAHAVVSAASAVVMEELFGKYLSFTDHTYDMLYGARSFTSFEHYAKEAGESRVVAGIHYTTSVDAGLTFGRKVGEAVIAVSPGHSNNNK